MLMTCVLDGSVITVPMLVTLTRELETLLGNVGKLISRVLVLAFFECGSVASDDLASIVTS